MNRFRNGRVAAAMLAPLVLAGTTAVAGASVTNPAKPQTSRPDKHEMTWTNTAPPIVIGAPQCNAAGQCLYPWTEAGQTTGDLQGTYIASGVASVNATGQFAVARIDTFTGTIEGCGTGSITLRETEDLGPAPKPTRWQVVDGFGTGDLAAVQGHGEGTGAADRRRADLNLDRSAHVREGPLVGKRPSGSSIGGWRVATRRRGDLRGRARRRAQWRAPLLPAPSAPRSASAAPIRPALS